MHIEGSAQSVGCTVDGQHPHSIIDKVKSGEYVIPDKWPPSLLSTACCVPPLLLSHCLTVVLSLLPWRPLLFIHLLSIPSFNHFLEFPFRYRYCLFRLHFHWIEFSLKAGPINFHLNKKTNQTIDSEFPFRRENFVFANGVRELLEIVEVLIIDWMICSCAVLNMFYSTMLAHRNP